MSRIFHTFLETKKLTQISACFIRIFDSFFRLLVASVMKGMAEKGVGLDFEATRGWYAKGLASFAAKRTFDCLQT